jgi:NAD(P)-dependent dehydrogenase (short-subunit alcohol dehydrogenase family)
MTIPPKIAIITGAASGIGRHWAETLAARPEEYRLALVDANGPGLAEVFEPSEGLCLYTFDIRSVDHWRDLADDVVRRFGRIDYLFNIAGGGVPGFLLDVPMELLDSTIDANLKGPIYGMRVVGPVMMRQRSGHIINVASLAGISSTPGNELYSAAKSGLRSISLSTAVRMRPKGVFVTVVCPDLVDTPTLARHLQSRPEDVALIHSGPGALSVEDVAEAFWRALQGRALEIAIPRRRGWLAKISNLFPPLMFLFYKPLMRKGLRRLEQLKHEREVTFD